MTKNLIIALVAAIPVFAQEVAPVVAPASAPAPMMDRKAFMEAHKAAFMVKFDTNKDGQLDDNEKKAVKEAFAKRGERKTPKFKGKREDRRPFGPKFAPQAPKCNCAK